MSSDQHEIDPKLNNMLVRQRKLAHYDRLKRQNAILIAFLVGLVVGVLSEVLRR